MKILQINAVTYGSTGRTSVELAEALEKAGHESIIAYSEGDPNWRRTIKIGNKFDHKIHAILSRLTGLQGYFSIYATKKLIRDISKFNPDIIHLRNLHANYISLPILFRYLIEKQIPTVITLHDCWFFTGKCTHYSERGCKKWQNLCHNCPALKTDNKSYFFDRTKKIFKDRMYWFKQLWNLRIVGVSKWTMQQALMSPIFTGSNICYIYNWIDLDTFKPTASDFRENLGIPRNKFVMLFVSAGWNNTSKTLELLEIADKIRNKNISIIVVGNKSKDVLFPNNIIHIPYVSNKLQMAQIYSMANVYVHLSTEDTFGKVIAEAMACGTPAIVYNTTALPELVDTYSGFIVEAHDTDAIIEKIELIHKIDKDKYEKHCINRVHKLFSMEKNTQEYIKLYELMLKY